MYMRTNRNILKEETVLLTRKEVAKQMKVSPDTVTAWTRQGMPCLYIGRIQETRRGARPRYVLDRCLEWLDKRNGYYNA